MTEPEPSKPVLSYGHPDEPPERYEVFPMILLSFALSFLFAIVYLVVFGSLHPLVADPLVIVIVPAVAFIAGTVVCLPTYFALRSREWITASFVLCATVVAEIVIVTPMNERAGFVGSFAAYAAGLLLARRFAIRL